MPRPYALLNPGGNKGDFVAVCDGRIQFDKLFVYGDAYAAFPEHVFPLTSAQFEQSDELAHATGCGREIELFAGGAQPIH